MRRTVERYTQWNETVLRAEKARGVALLGICNVTPDSFSDGGAFDREETWKNRIDAILAEGADAIDVGPESTRRGATPVDSATQVARALEPVRYALSKGAIVSIDTTDAAVAEACLSAGAHAVNDVSCGAHKELALVAAKYRAAYVLMHSRPHHGTPGWSTRADLRYKDVVATIDHEWNYASAKVIAAGVEASGIYFDPGIGFAKTSEDSLAALKATPLFVDKYRGRVLLGVSRKSLLETIDPGASPLDRIGGSIAVALWARAQGVSLLRVHDVRATKQALDWDAALHASGFAHRGTIPVDHEQDEVTSVDEKPMGGAACSAG